MKIFNKDGKINFVDDNNVFVGFDYERHCCESFGWMITSEIPKKVECGDGNINAEGFNFDIIFFLDTIESYEGNVAIFKLSKGIPVENIYLTLWNCHNGFYSHNFELTHNGNKLRVDCI